MRTKHWIVCFTIVLACYSCQKEMDIEKEKKAIIAVIEEETNAFNTRDLNRFSATYVHSDETYWLGASQSEYWFNSGWEEIETIFRDYFENNPDPGSVRYEKSNFRIKVYKECAWSISDQKVYSGSSEIVWEGLEVRFLEKVKGDWKITYLFYIDTSSYEGSAMEEEEPAGPE